jgi:hypothetical protein
MPLPVLIAAALLGGCATSPPPEPDDTRDKGGSAVEILVDGRGWLAPGDAIHPGERIQVRVPAGAPGEVWIGDGERVLGHFAVAAARPTLSPFALMVDAAPGDEVLVVVRSSSPIAGKTAQAAMNGGKLDGVQVTRLHLTKEQGDSWR